MRIVEQSVEILSVHGESIDGSEVLKHLERVGRTCYKSEDKITDQSAEKFIRGIVKSGHGSIIEHYSLTVKFITSRDVTHQLVRHRVASFCLDGDTVIRSTGQKSWTIKQLYEWQNDPKRSGRIPLMNIRSVNSENVLVSNKINKVFNNGIKPCYTLTTESGRSITCTKEHQFLTPEGFKELSHLLVGDLIYSNGLELLDNRDWLFDNYINNNRTRKSIAKEIGCCETLVHRAFKKFKIVKPKSLYPNRGAGHGKKGMFSDESKKLMSDNHKGCLNPSYKEDRNSITESSGYSEANRSHKEVERFCEECGHDVNVEIHHKDKNPRNNHPSNLKMLCQKHHKAWHREGTLATFKDKIVSIVLVGDREVFDLEMADPYHNYVANGLVVHNSQESQRYCNYSLGKFGEEVVFVRPVYLLKGTHAYSTWEKSCKISESAYFMLIDEGCTAEEARAVLPNCAKTELMMTANLREWRHFFEVRCDHHAQLPIRLLAIDLLRQMTNLIPVVFDDLYLKFVGEDINR